MKEVHSYDEVGIRTHLCVYIWIVELFLRSVRIKLLMVKFDSSTSPGRESRDENIFSNYFNHKKSAIFTMLLHPSERLVQRPRMDEKENW